MTCVKPGPQVVEATLSYDHTNRRCTIEGRGIDQRGASRALANGEVSASGTTETELAVQGEYTVSGPLETFANAGGVHVARALLAEFAKNMGTLAAERRGSVPAAATPPAAEAAPASTAQTPAAPSAASTTAPSAKPEPVASPRQAAELNAFALLLAAFKSWLSSLFGKRS
jgi:cell division septation protein DedD